MLRHPSALRSLAEICRQDHRATATGSSASAKASKKGKGKSKDANGAVDELESDDGRDLLIRLLLCGVLRNVVKMDSPVDDAIDLRSLTSEVVLPLINGLLDVNLDDVVAKVSRLVSEAVSADPVPRVCRVVEQTLNE